MLNQKGFAVTTMVYGMMALASLILFLTLDIMSSNKKTTTNYAQDIEDELNKCTYYSGSCYNWHEWNTKYNFLVQNKDDLLCTLSGKKYTKTADGQAIVAIVKYQATDDTKTCSAGFCTGPLMVSTTLTSVYFTSDNKIIKPGGTEDINKMIYKNKPYYISSNGYYMCGYDAGSDTLNYELLNDITGKTYTWGSNGKEEAARDLLDYYFSS